MSQVFATDEADFERQFKIMVSGGERTRGILYFFCIILVGSLTFFFSDHFDTNLKRLEILDAALNCVNGSLARDALVPLPDFVADKSEEEKHCGYYYGYVQRFYRISMDDLQNRTTLITEKRSLVLKQYADASTLSIPVLNTRIDVNSALMFQNSVAAFILYILLLSLRAERKCLTRIESFIDGRPNRAGAILDTHVFLLPSFANTVLWLVVFLPCVALPGKLYDDFSVRDYVMKLYGPKDGALFYWIEIGSSLVVFILSASCYRLAWTIRDGLGRIARVATAHVKPAGEGQ